MGWRFRKSLSILPGLRLNFGRRGVSASAGIPGARVSVNSKGQSAFTLSAPGTGLSFRQVLNEQKKMVGVVTGRDDAEVREVYSHTVDAMRYEPTVIPRRRRLWPVALMLALLSVGVLLSILAN